MNLVLSLTHRCNLRCTYCYAGEKFRSRITREVIDKSLELGFKHPSRRIQVSFFGGEPLLEPELVEYAATRAREVAEASEKSLVLSMTTNGTCLTDENLEMIRRHRIHLAVSVDGTREAHDAARLGSNGRGTFEAVDAGLRRAFERLPQVDTISVVHPGNVDLLGDSFDYLAGLGSRRLAFNLDYDAGWAEEDLDTLERSYNQLADRAIAHYRAGNDYTLGPLHAKIISRLKDGFCDSDRCDFGCGEIAVAPSGNLYPCDRLIGGDGPDQDDIRIGDVDAGIDTERVLALRRAKDQVKPECEECEIVDRCMWWCGCVNRTQTGQVDDVSGFLCQVEQIVVGAADRLASTLFAEGNKPFMSRYYLAASALERARRKQP